jgi:tRNA dimethylallyltransferase
MSLARSLGAEIVGADSRQIYRLLDIGTDKPSIEDRAAIPHHLVDIVLPDEPYTVADFHRDATAALASIWARERPVLVVGGSGFYLRAVLEGLRFPPRATDPSVRTDISRELDRVGVEAAMAEIARVDPRTAARLTPKNRRRVERALEIIRVTGAPVPESEIHPLPALILGLDMERRDLYCRTDKRVDLQMERGLVEETQGLLSMGYSTSLPVLSGLGYGQMVQFLAGSLALDEAVQRYKNATHALIRRQLTWFRRDPRITWLDAAGDTLYRDAMDLVERYLVIWANGAKRRRQRAKREETHWYN